MAEKAWYEEGFPDTIEMPRSQSQRNIRFWVNKGHANARSIIFLTEKPIVLYEHQFQLGGSYYNWLTCLRPLGLACPFCDANKNRYRAAIWTILDVDGYVDSNSVEHKNIKRLFVAKSKTYQRVKLLAERRAEKGESLKGAKYHVTRTESDKSPNVGDDFEFEGMVDLSQFEDAEPMKYEELLAPNKEEMERVLKIMTGEGEGAVSNGQIPF